MRHPLLLIGLFIFSSIVGSFVFCANVQAVDEEYNPNDSQVETQIINPDGSAEDVSLDDEVATQDENSNPAPDATEVYNRESVIDENVANQKIDMTSTYDPEIFSAITFALKNFVKESKNDSTDDPNTTNAINNVLLNSDIVQVNMDNMFTDIEKRGTVLTFIIGPNYKILKNKDNYLVDIDNIYKQTNYLSQTVQNAQLSDMLKAFGSQFAKKGEEYKKRATQVENKKSLLGWIIKKFI